MKYDDDVTFSLSEYKVDLFKRIFADGNEKWYESSYGGNRFAFPVSDALLAEIKRNAPELLTHIGFNDMFGQYIRMIVQMQPISPEFVKQYDVADWQIRLLRRSYFDFEDVDGDGVKCITLAYKRPWGNSYVLGDVLEEMNISQYVLNKKGEPKIDKKTGDYIEIDTEPYEPNIDVAAEVIRKFLVHHPFDPNLEALFTRFRFEPTAAYLRKNKIENIL